jgi:hypothetical protein
MPTTLRIGFFTPQLNVRGTCRAIYDYAHWAERELGYSSVILSTRNHFLSDDDTIRQFARRFQILWCDETPAEFEDRFDVLYEINAGDDTGIRVKCPHFVHVVYRCNALYADLTLMARPTELPHMVDLEPKPELGDFREVLGIPRDAVVFGRHGGKETFNVKFCKELMGRLVREHPHIHFCFLNADAFDDHPHIHILPASSNSTIKRRFIQTCDAMIVPEFHGHTFGLAIAEFAVHNKPLIILDRDPTNRVHLDITEGHAYIFNSGQSFIDQILHVADAVIGARATPALAPRTAARDYDAFKPLPVIRVFEACIAECIRRHRKQQSSWPGRRVRVHPRYKILR